MDRDLITARAAWPGARSGNSSSPALSLAMCRPGLTRTNSHNRLALGRGQGPAHRDPSAMENEPKRLTLRRVGTEFSSRAGAGILDYPASGRSRRAVFLRTGQLLQLNASREPQLSTSQPRLVFGAFESELGTHRLDFRVLPEDFVAHLTPPAGLLVAAKRQGGVIDVVAIDPHSARP
jgi:hypothetical protein